MGMKLCYNRVRVYYKYLLPQQYIIIYYNDDNITLLYWEGNIIITKQTQMGLLTASKN